MKFAQLFDVSGLATIVTGGASGIGLACAEAMGDNGARVTLIDADSETLQSAVKKQQSRGNDVRGAVVDVTDRAALHRAFDEAAACYGRIDVVFANRRSHRAPSCRSVVRSRARSVPDARPSV